MMEGLESVKLTSIEERPEYGRFVFEPLLHGFGTTMGNALRRILLSSIRGSAPVALRVNNALHEFTSLPGIKEDLQELILNVRNLQVSIVEGDEATLVLKRQGKGTVLADDLEKNSLVKLYNPGLKIAELSGDDSVIDLQITVRSGVGYVSNEENHELLGGTVDTIALDSIFSPVRTANYAVEPVRIKQKADYERLVVEINHFPTVKAREVMMQAIDILAQHADQLLLCVKNAPSRLAGGSLETAGTSNSIDAMDQEIANVSGITNRPADALRKSGIVTIGDYLEHRGESIPGFGEASRRAVDDALTAIGVSIPEED
ncbi:MAG: hypothetical protein Q7V53_06980 [Caldisericota bacterium]|jgi:DNA-directed RNA polymerase subunit alpha|nr:hypothetical protein [Caldisericota bacterium]